MKPKTPKPEPKKEFFQANAPKKPSHMRTPEKAKESFRKGYK